MSRTSTQAEQGDDEEDSENEAEYAARMAAMQRLALAQFAGPAAAQALQLQQAVRSAKEQRVAGCLAALAAFAGPLATWPPAPMPVADADDETRAALRAECRENPALKHLDRQLVAMHAAFRQSRAAGALQCGLWACAARPPWPPFSGAKPVTLRQAQALLEAELGLRIGGTARLGPHHVALLGEWPMETMTAGLAVVFAVSSSSGSSSTWTSAALLPRAQFPDTAQDAAVLQYVRYAWVPLALVVAAAAGSGVR